jgi:PAS domain-containing protein
MDNAMQHPVAIPQQLAGDAETRFQALLSAAPDAIVIVDQASRIVIVNTQAERLFGYRRRELIDQPVDILLPERLRAAPVGRHHDQVGVVCRSDVEDRLSGRASDQAGVDTLSLPRKTIRQVFEVAIDLLALGLIFSLHPVRHHTRLGKADIIERRHRTYQHEIGARRGCNQLCLL